jgi:hypothetical protein
VILNVEEYTSLCTNFIYDRAPAEYTDPPYTGDGEVAGRSGAKITLFMEYAESSFFHLHVVVLLESL